MEEIPPEVEHVHAHALAGEDRAENSCRFKGIRLRKWGSWIAEIRMPRSRQKLWLGSYKTAEQAARAYDAAVCCLRGPNARLNFPNSVSSIPSASSLSRQEIQLAAARHATLGQLPAILASEHNNNENASANDNKAREDPASPSQSALVQETVSLMNCQHQQEQELALWESPFAGSADCPTNHLEMLPSIDEASALNLIPIPSWEEQHNEQQQEEEMNNFVQLRDLCNFRDVGMNSGDEEEYYPR